MQGVRAIPTDDEFAQLCEKTGGNISAIAQNLGVSRTTVSDWVTKTESFKQAVDDARESALDLCEDRAMQLIAGIPRVNEEGKTVAWTERPDSGLIKFVLATRGKKRGYGESVAVTDADGEKLIINFIGG